MRLLHHRRALHVAGPVPGRILVVADQDIDLVAVERAAGALRFRGFVGRHRLRTDEQVDVVHQVVADGVEVRDHPRQVGQLRLGLLDRLPDREARGLPVELPDRAAALLFQPRDRAQGLFQFRLQLRDRRLRGVALFLRPGVELLGRHHLAVLGGRHGETGRRALDHHALGQRLVVQRGEAGLAGAADAFLDGAAPALVVVAVERRRDRRLQVVDQAAHRRVEFGRATGRQGNRRRPVRLGEVVDLAPVERPRPPRRLGFQQHPDRPLHAGVRGADGEDVEAARADPGAERQCVAGALVADRSVERLEVGGGGECERCDIGAPVQPVGGQR